MMPAAKSAPKHTTAADTSAAVDAFIAGLPEPKRSEVGLLRAAILGSAEGISEGIKWNAPSFKTHEYFATMHLRAKTGVGLVLHLGAKLREPGAVRETLADPAGLLNWVGQDRATLSFRDAPDIRAQQAALQALLQQWVRYV